MLVRMYCLLATRLLGHQAGAMCAPALNNAVVNLQQCMFKRSVQQVLALNSTAAYQGQATHAEQYNT